MKNSTPLLKTLLVAAVAMSFCATTVWADDVTLTEDATTIYPSLSSTTATVGVANYVISDGSNSGWMFVVQSSSTAPMQSYTTITFETGTTFSGTGLFGIYFQQGFASTTETVDLTNVDASSLSGQLSVENAYNNVTIVKVKGDTWSNVEYLFGDAEGSHHGTSGDTLTLTDSTTFAGISGTTAGTGETITVETASASLTLAGSGEYGFYGALGTSSTRASLAMTGEGKQTFGGTNYLQDVSVTAGTLALGGTTDISGTASVDTGATLDLSGTITLGSAISNSGTITIADETCFVLDNLTQTYDPDRGYGYCQLIEGSGGTLNYTESSISFSFDGSTIDWSIYVDGSGNVYAYGTVGELTWAGTESSNTWNTTDANWVVEGSADKTTFIEGDSATFGADGYKTVNITESLNVGSITVEDSYTFALADKVTLEADHINVSSGKTLTLQMADSGTATVHMDGESFVDLLTGADGYGTIEIGKNVTLYLSDYNNGNYTINGSNAHGSITGTGTLSLGSNGELGLYLPDFKGTVEIRSGTLRIGYQNSYETGVFNENATLQFDSGVGLTLVGNTSSPVTAALVFEEGSHTIATNDHTAEFSGTISGEKADITITGKGNLTFYGSSISFGSLSLSTAGSTISVGEGSVLKVTNGITYSTGSATTTASNITGAGADKSTVITGNLQVGSGNGAGVQISDVTFITGGITYGNNNGLNFYLFFDNATLGFTQSTTIAAPNAGGYRFGLGPFSGSSTSGSSTTTINTSQYVEGTGFTDTGLEITISAVVSGSGALEVTGTGKLILSAENTFTGGTTIRSGTVVSQNASALGSGSVSVESGATLQLDVAVTTSGDVAFADGAKLIISGELLEQLETAALAADDGAVAIIIANDISFGGQSVSGASDLDSLINAYVSAGNYLLTWTWNDGTLSASIVRTIPEPSMFGLSFGLGAIGLVATRRRRRKVA